MPPAKKVADAAPTPAPAPTPVLPPLPTWTDPASIASYVTSLLTGILAAITALHPGFMEPPVVQSLVPVVSLIVAGAVQGVNIIFHRKAQIAVIQASAPR